MPPPYIDLIPTKLYLLPHMGVLSLKELVKTYLQLTRESDSKSRASEIYPLLGVHLLDSQ